MSTNVPRTKSQSVMAETSPTYERLTGKLLSGPSVNTIGQTISVLKISEGHPVNRKTGKRESGGPFYVTHSGPYFRPGILPEVIGGNSLLNVKWGPVFGTFVKSTGIASHFNGATPDMDESSMNADGATAVSQCSPTNPTANLSTTLAETFREGVPSLPGIQSWKRRTEVLRAAGSEYLNYQFGWNPLQNEVHNVVSAARHHRDIMQNYAHNEGRNVHRRFDFSPEIEQWEEELSPAFASIGFGSTYLAPGATAPTRIARVKNTRKRWFEGCFTYGGPSNLDNFRRSLGFGSEADAVFGLSLTPDVLWELTPWSWAVDWFTNAGDVIHNISSFAAAGLVMRYGYMMEETTSTSYTEFSDTLWNVGLNGRSSNVLSKFRGGSSSIGQTVVRKMRVPANPFGFGIGWEGLSPTQLAITAALGITRLL